MGKAFESVEERGIRRVGEQGFIYGLSVDIGMLQEPNYFLCSGGTCVSVVMITLQSPRHPA